MKKLFYSFVILIGGVICSNCSSDDDSSENIPMNADCTDEEVFNLVEQKCGIAACHGGPQSPNFASVDDINSRKSRILSRTTSRTMPPANSGISLTDAELELIQCWVN